MKKKYDYWCWRNFISKENIEKINKSEPIYHYVNNGIRLGLRDKPAPNVTKTSKVKFLSYSKIKKYLQNAVLNCYISNKERFGYKLFDYNEEDFLHYNTYSSDNKGQYGWHTDCEEDFFVDIKLTVLINLSEEPYEGGQFKLNISGFPVEELSNPGDMIMFKSHILHKVEPVTKGTRKSLTIFLKGPNFKWKQLY